MKYRNFDFIVCLSPLKITYFFKVFKLIQIQIYRMYYPEQDSLVVYTYDESFQS